MRTANVTYNAPEGDNKVVEMGGLTFFDGQPVKINDDEHRHLFGKLQNNQHFAFEEGPEEQSPEDDDLSGKPVAELRAIAAQRGIDVKGLKKAEIIEKLAA